MYMQHREKKEAGKVLVLKILNIERQQTARLKILFTIGKAATNTVAPYRLQ